MIVPRKFFSFLGLGFTAPAGDLQSIRIRERIEMVESDTGEVVMSRESDTMAIPADDPQLGDALGQTLTAALSRVLVLEGEIRTTLQELATARQELADYQASHRDQVAP